MPTDLPSNASPESRSRLKLSTYLASCCPAELASAIAVTGSASRGYADRFSDIELYFQVEDLLPVARYEAWLRSTDGLDEPETMEWNSGHLTKSWHSGVFVKGAWRPSWMWSPS